MVKIEDCLSPNDVQQFKDIGAVFQSHDGEFLASVEDCDDKSDGCRKRKYMMDMNEPLLAQLEESFALIEATFDGSISMNSVFSSHRKSWEGMSLETQLHQAMRYGWIEYFRLRNGRRKLSAGLLEFLFPSDEDDTRVEFRSQVPGFWHQGELKVVCVDWRASHRRKKAGGEFCLAACDDGKVRWIHESECVNGNQVWKVRLFDIRVGDAVYLRDELRRPQPNVYNNCVFRSTTIGSNVNGSGTQIIGDVNNKFELKDFRTGLTATAGS